MLFGKKQVTEVRVTSGKEVVFLIRSSAKGVEIENAAKTWCLAFSAGTYECGAVNYYISKENNEALLILARAEYLTTMFFRDAKLVNEFHKAFQRSMKRLANSKSALPTEDDEIILAEEKLLHEKDEESLNELIDLKKRKANGKKRNHKK